MSQQTQNQVTHMYIQIHERHVNLVLFDMNDPPVNLYKFLFYNTEHTF